MEKTALGYGMVGGGLKAFIGAAHRTALGFFPGVALEAGCFSGRPEENEASARALGVAPERCYASASEMARAEAARSGGIRFAVITTPNRFHYEAARAFLENGIPVLCEKPLCFTSEEGAQLAALAEARGLPFGVAYTYSGHAMLRLMRAMVLGGEIGEVLHVDGSFLAEGMLAALQPENAGMQRAGWRSDPALVGCSLTTGDIGTHIEYIGRFVTGLSIERLCAVTECYGGALDLSARMLLRFASGASGSYWCSKLCAGHSNDLSLRVFGTKGSLEWRQLEPETLRFAKPNAPVQTLLRGRDDYNGVLSTENRLPAGHPEGYYEALANLYKGFLADVRAYPAGETQPSSRPLYPTAQDGREGVRFVEAVIESGRGGGCWVAL